jgi:transcriptional regulator with XRE-family HTH domain
MGPISDYHERLASLVRGEFHRLGISQAEMADILEVTPQAISRWINKKLGGELSPGSLNALAEHLGRSRAALQHYLETGKWIEDQLTLSDRVAALERMVGKLSPGGGREAAAFYAVRDSRDDKPSEVLLEMTPLGKALQSAFIAIGQDWREPAAISAAWGIYRRSKDQCGLGYDTDFGILSITKFQQIVWGLQLPTENECGDLSLIMEYFTGDPVWSHEYVATLAAQRIAQGNKKGRH